MGHEGSQMTVMRPLAVGIVTGPPFITAFRPAPVPAVVAPTMPLLRGSVISASTCSPVLKHRRCVGCALPVPLKLCVLRAKPGREPCVIVRVARHARL